MTRKSAGPSTTPVPRYAESKGMLMVGTSFIETTWRIALPVLGLSIPAIIIDRYAQTAPMFTLGAMSIGFGIAAFLIFRLIKRIASVPVRNLQESDR